ncbi:MAG TPA: DUF58 domain-containing protein [Acidimicrobiia bacterium]
MSRSSFPTPVALRKLGLAFAVLAVALLLVGRTTGAGWNVVILCVLAAILAIGALTPIAGLLRVRIRAGAPRDAVAGRPFELTITASGRARTLRLRTLDPESSWTLVDAPCTGALTVLRNRRGVLDTVLVELRSAHALGLVDWRRRVRMQLPAPIEVGPRPERVPFRAHRSSARTTADALTAARSGAELTRGVREYTPGDPVRLLHWPATARAGTPMVRELDGPQRPRLIVVADLRTFDPERTAALAAGAAIDALAHGARVDLATAEASGPRFGRVTTPIDVGRRLARAVEGPPPEGPFDPDCQVLRPTGHR